MCMCRCSSVLLVHSLQLDVSAYACMPAGDDRSHRERCVTDYDASVGVVDSLVQVIQYRG